MPVHTAVPSDEASKTTTTAPKMPVHTAVPFDEVRDGGIAISYKA